MEKNITRSLIEDWFPVKEVSEEAKKEKPGRAPIFELHYWWTRKPLIVSRATVLGALLPSDKISHKEFIKLLGNPPGKQRRCYHLNLDNNQLSFLRKTYKEVWGTEEPLILDSMAGGGSIPFEGSRVGAKSIGIEYNPVGYLILKATIEYPQKYGSKLAEDVEKWGSWVLKKVKDEIGDLYPEHEKGPVSAYLWYRAIECPKCNLYIPLASHWVLSTRNKVVLKLNIPEIKNDVTADIIYLSELKRKEFDPSQGTIRRSTVECPRCKNTIGAKSIKAMGKQNKIKHKLLAVVVRQRNRGKIYEKPTDNDENAIENAEKILQKKWQEFVKEGLICEEAISEYEKRAIYVQPYGIDKWYKLFNSRQLLAHLTFTHYIRQAREEILQECLKKGMDNKAAKEYTKAIMTYLALTLDKLLSFNSSLTIWSKDRETIAHIFSYRGISMVWNYVEVNPFIDASGTWISALRDVTNSIRFASSKGVNPSIALYGSAITLPYKDESFHAVIVDPPYYDDVPYGELSDFWYVWLKRILVEDYPEVFSTQLVPKDEEIDFNPGRHGSEEASRVIYETLLRKSFSELKRVLRKNGIGVIIFAHSSSEAWESVINALLDAGFYVTATWPVRTETEAGVLRQRAAFLSSILIVVRKREGDTTTWFEELKPELRKRIWERLTEFYDNYKLSGGDLFIASIGPAIEVFGKYSSIKSYTGETVPISKVLNEMRALTTDYVFEKLANEPGIASKVDAATRFYVVARWTYTFRDKDGKWKTSMPFDEARKLAISLGTSLDSLENSYKILKIEKGSVLILNVVDREHEQIIDLRRPKSNCLLDALHLAILAYKMGGTNTSTKLLSNLGLKGAPEIRAVAQALLQALPEEEEEHKLIAQFLLGLPAGLERELKGPLDKFLPQNNLDLNRIRANVLEEKEK